MKKWDYEIINKNDKHVLVIRDEFNTAVYACDNKGNIKYPDDILIKTHLTYEQNFVAYRQTIGLIKTLAQQSDHDFEWYNYCIDNNLGVNYIVEVIDSLKIYDTINNKEHIYVDINEYDIIDGSHTEHMKLCRDAFIQIINSNNMTLI